MNKNITRFVFILILSLFFSCGPLIEDHKTEEIKIVRILSPVEAEIISHGSLEIVVLAGVSFITEDEFREKYLKTGKIEEKFSAEIIDRIKKSSHYLSTTISHGDELYAVNITKDSEVFKVRQMVIYTPDMMSINEKMVLEGYGFPGRETASAQFDIMIKESMSKAILYRKGLWRIGKIMSEESSTDKK